MYIYIYILNFGRDLMSFIYGDVFAVAFILALRITESLNLSYFSQKFYDHPLS